MVMALMAGKKLMDRKKKKEMNPGLMALKKEAPEVVKRMGFNYGGKIDKMMGGGMVMKEKMKMMGGGHSKDKMKMMGGGYGKDYMKKKMRMGGKIRYGHGGTTSCPINGMAKRGRTKGKMV